MERGGSVYILTNKNRTTLYIGVTSNLFNRIIEHQTHKFPNSFSARYNLEFCVYYENFYDIEQAIGREKEIKKWNKQKKIAQIHKMNPLWNDLFEEIKKLEL